MSEPIKIEAEFDVDGLKQIVEEATTLQDNKELFRKLADIERVKKQAKDIIEKVDSIVEEAKGLINSKASALYGNEWEALKGEGYKITKSPTGAVFAMSPDGKVQKKFKVVNESLDTKAVNEYIKEKGKLPSGIEYNPTRGHSIRITVHENDQA